MVEGHGGGISVRIQDDSYRSQLQFLQPVLNLAPLHMSKEDIASIKVTPWR